MQQVVLAVDTMQMLLDQMLVLTQVMVVAEQMAMFLTQQANQAVAVVLALLFSNTKILKQLQ
jgi:hypothetical protein